MQGISRWSLCLSLLAVMLLASAANKGSCFPEPVDTQPYDEYLDNGVIRIGVDLGAGGAISFLAEANNLDVNLINSSDLGRYVQQSYYSGPWPYGNPHPSWENWGWNPIGAGDCYGNPAEVVQSSNDGTTLYVKTIPRQWALDDVPCECTFEQWITLDQNGARVRFRLNNNRSDTTNYGSSHQELPAVYTTDRFHRLFTYQGSSPGSWGLLTQISNSGPPWAYYTGTERWSALIDDNDWGLGVYNPATQSFVAGFHGSPGSGDPTGGSCGYIAPLRTESIRYNTVYNYEVYLVLGYINDIRAYVYAH